MKFYLEFVMCCSSCSSETGLPVDEARFLVIQEPRRRVARKYGRVSGGTIEWRPSLSSISEDVLTAEKIKEVERPLAAWRLSIKRKIASLVQTDWSRSLDHGDRRRAPISAIMPAFAPTPFMF